MVEPVPMEDFHGYRASLLYADDHGILTAVNLFVDDMEVRQAASKDQLEALWRSKIEEGMKELEAAVTTKPWPKDAQGREYNPVDR